jgi:hypothetical protein
MGIQLLASVSCVLIQRVVRGYAIPNVDLIRGARVFSFIMALCSLLFWLLLHAAGQARSAQATKLPINASPEPNVP